MFPSLTSGRGTLLRRRPPVNEDFEPAVFRGPGTVRLEVSSHIDVLSVCNTEDGRLLPPAHGNVHLQLMDLSSSTTSSTILTTGYVDFPAYEGSRARGVSTMTAAAVRSVSPARTGPRCLSHGRLGLI